ncbi:hypothetical protein D3C81_1942790 [compost metagenome]
MPWASLLRLTVYDKALFTAAQLKSTWPFPAAALTFWGAAGKIGPAAAIALTSADGADSPVGAVAVTT